MHSRDEIRDWLKEVFEAVEEAGACSVVSLKHYSNVGDRETELQSLRSGMPKWGNPDEMAAFLDTIATRHAKGLTGGGAQQFELGAIFGTSGKPTRFLPFSRIGALSFGAGGSAAGALSSEPPTAIGQVQQHMRQSEVLVQTAVAQIQPTFQVQNAIIADLRKRIAELEFESRELFVALRQQLIDTAQLAHDSRMKELEYLRATEERRKLIRLLPALTNAISGRTVFPESTEDTAIVEALAGTIDGSDIAELAKALDGKVAPEVLTVLTSRFATLRERRVAEEEELRKISRETKKSPISFVVAERDAGGEPTAEDKALPERKGEKP